MANQDTIYVDGVNYRPKIKSSYLSPDDFPALIEQLVDMTFPNKPFSFSEDFQASTDAITPSVVWHVHNRIASDGGERRQPKPKRVDLLKTSKSTAVAVDQQPWNIIYQFDCCGETNMQANAVRRQFEAFMRDMSPVFASYGAKIVFEEQLDDKLANRNNERLRVRSIRYRVIIRELIEHNVDLIERIKLELAGAGTLITKEQVIRGEGFLDTLASERIYKMVEIASESDPTRIYVQGLDFHIVDVSGKSYIEWISGGISPVAGTTYTATYYPQNMLTDE